MGPGSDYVRVAAAIDHLASAGADQPSVADVARHLHVSEPHLRRLFARWAGVSPKRYLQHVTALRGRDLLRDAQPSLAVAHEVGLSGGGRLHDLMTTIDAMTPGEVGADGAGTTIRVGVHETPFGRATVAVTDRGICGVRFHGPGEDRADEIAGEWPAASVVSDPSGTRQAADRITSALRASVQREPVRLVVRGTNLQVQVWRALLAIPPGEVRTYAQIAAAVGNPRAVRGVASAIGRNPVGYLIPCHRVLRGDGDLAGYRWGVDRKRAMLAVEEAAARRISA